MRIPWGAIALIGGLILVYGTDLPSFIGWIAVGWGIFSILLQIIAMITMVAVRDFVKNHPGELEEKLTYRTNFGRNRPLQTRNGLVAPPKTRKGGDKK